MERCIYDTLNIQLLKHPIIYEYSGISQTLPLHSIGPLKKKTSQIHIVLDGKGTLSVEDKLYKIEKGGIFILPQDTYFFYQSDSVDPWSYVWFGFSCDDYMLERLIADTPFSKTFCFTAEQTIVTKLYQLVVSALKTKSDTFSNALQCNAILLEFMSVLTSMDINHLAIPDSELSNNPIAKSAMSYLFTHYFEDITIPEVADYCHIDQSYLNRIFKKQYNLTPNQALILIRLNQAIQLLLYSSLSITEIVFEVGFHSQTVFDRAFKKHFNMSPTKFRSEFLIYENDITNYKQDDIFKEVLVKPTMTQAT